jgi:nitrile hydratase
MDGMHDLGGKQGFGAVRYALNAQVFHAPWEKRVNALYSLAVKLGIFNMDEYRHAIERMEPRHYLTASYYERSLTSLATLCVEKGIFTVEELERRANGAFPLASASASSRATVCACAPITSPAMRACPATSAASAASWWVSRRSTRSPTRTRTA